MGRIYGIKILSFWKVCTVENVKFFFHISILFYDVIDLERKWNRFEEVKEKNAKMDVLMCKNVYKGA